MHWMTTALSKAKMNAGYFDPDQFFIRLSKSCPEKRITLAVNFL